MLIALSGGADSVALLLYMLERGEVAAAAHCNFQLRGAESNRDEAFVRALCEERGVRLFVRRFETEAEAHRCGESIEMAARRLRYEWFAELCRAEGFRKVAVAHHREDNVETVLLNLIRGTGLHGLTGMEKEREDVCRPLLHWSKQEILDFLRQRGQDYVTDSSNSDTRYRRNKIRHELLPLLRTINPSIERTVQDMADRFRETEAIYALKMTELRKAMIQEGPDGGMTIDFARLTASPFRQTLLHEWVGPYGFTAGQLTDALSMKLGGLLEAKQWLLTRTKEALLINRRPIRLSSLPIPPENDCLRLDGHGSLQVSIRKREEREDLLNPKKATIDLSAVKGELYVRSVKSGDRIQPIGMNGTKLLNDLLTERGRNRIEKLQALVVCDGEGPIWLVDERLSQRVAVTPQTHEVIIIHHIDL